MNIYDFINSKDIREYWKMIDYKPNTLESAWLVWQSHKHTLAQKHAAWQEIISTMPDCSIEKCQTNEKVRSLHTYLKNHMDFQEQSIKSFYVLGPQMYYNGVAYYNDGEAWDPSVYLSVESCIKHYTTDYGDHGAGHQCVSFEIDKLRMGECAEDMKLSVDAFNHVLDIKVHGKYNLFESLRPNFPIPFKKGDIVKMVPVKYCRESYLRDTFALTSVCIESDCVDYFAENGDGSDMTVHGYFVGSMGEVYHECIHNYMDLEYIRGELRDEERVLLPISKYLQGEIDLGLLLGAQRIMLCEDGAKTANRLLNYTKEEKEVAGIET